MKKTLTILLALLIVLFLAAPVFAGGGKEEASGGAEETETAKEKKLDLVYLSKWNPGEVTQLIIDDVIEQYNNEHDNVTITPTWAGREVNVKLMAMLQAKSQVDFYDEDPNLIEESLGKSGLALDLTPYLKNVKAYDQDKMVIDTFSKGFFEPWTFRGEINSLPIQQYLTMMWYDKTMFKELGISKLPATWPEFIQLCETLKSKGVPPLVQDGGVDFYNLYYYAHTVQRILGSGAVVDAVNDKTGAAWDKPGYLEAAKKVYELSSNGYFIDGFEGYQFPAGQIDWAQREGAMLLIHTYMPIEVADAVPDDFVFGCFPFPSIPGGKGNRYDIASVVGAIAILKATEDPDVAFDFLKRIVSKETQTRFAQEAKNVPAITGVPLPAIFSDLEEIMEKQTGTFKDISGGPGAFEPQYAQTIMYPMASKLLFGDVTPEEFIAQVKEKSIAYWKNK